MSESPHTLTLEGQDYWIGLVWRSLEVENRKAVSTLSRELGARQGVIIENVAAGTLSVGFLTEQEGRKERLPSLAAAIASSVDQDTLVIEQTGMESAPLWLCCIRDGMIWPGTDRVGSLEDIATQARDLIALSGNPLALAGSGAVLALPDSAPQPLVAPDKVQIKTAMVGGLGGVQPKQILALAALIAVAVGGYLLWAGNSTQAKQAQAQQEIAQRRQAAERAMVAWVAEFQAAPVQETVRRMLATINTPNLWQVPGWQVSSALCTPTDCRVSWARDDGTPSDLVARSGIADVRLELTGKAATVTLALVEGVPSSGGAAITLPGGMSALAGLLDIQADLIRIGAGMELQGASPVPVTDINLLPPERQSQSGAWSASGKGATLMSAGTLLDAPFTSVKSLLLKFDHEVSWTLEGMYVLR